MHAWLQAMQARMSSRRPASASAGMLGSQMSALFMMTASAKPSAMMRSASCGWFTRPAANTGTETRSFTLAM